jgi:hypothetical protein
MASNGDYSRKELWRKAKTRAVVLNDAEIRPVGWPPAAAESRAALDLAAVVRLCGR